MATNVRSSAERQWVGPFQPYALGLLRAVAALLFWQHGVWKLFGWFGGHPVPAYSLFWFAGLIETIGAPLLFIGLLTRPVAILLCGEMTVAYLTQHLPHGFWPIQNQGLGALQFWSIFLLLATAGAGAFSVDALLEGDSGPKKHGSGQVLALLYPAALTILRITTAFLFWNFAARKLFGWLGGRVAKHGTRLWFAGMLEGPGSLLIASGALTRCVAFVLCGEMAVAYWTSHYPRGHFWPIQNGGEPAVLFCFVYLFLTTSGAGPLSLDSLIFRKSK